MRGINVKIKNATEPGPANVKIGNLPDSPGMRRVRVSYDRGYFDVRLYASSDLQARRIVCEVEGCLDSAIMGVGRL